MVERQKRLILCFLRLTSAIAWRSDHPLRRSSVYCRPLDLSIDEFVVSLVENARSRCTINYCRNEPSSSGVVRH